MDKGYQDLLPNEKQAVKAVLDPSEAKRLDDQNRQQNPAIAAHGDAVDALIQRKTQAEDRILDLYNQGQLDKSHTVNAMRAVQKDYFASKDKADADPAYQKELAVFKGQDKNDAQKALDAYYQIGQHYTDRSQRQQEQTKYIQWLQAKDPSLASRIVVAIQPRNQTKLEQMYAAGELN